MTMHDIITRAFPWLTPNEQHATSAFCFDILSYLQIHAPPSTPIYLRLSPFSPLLTAQSPEHTTPKNPRSEQIPRLMRSIAQYFKLYQGIIYDLAVGPADLDLIVPYEGRVMPAFPQLWRLGQNNDGILIDARPVVRSRSFDVHQYELINYPPVPFMIVHLATQRYDPLTRTPISYPAELRVILIADYKAIQYSLQYTLLITKCLLLCLRREYLTKYHSLAILNT